MVYETMIFSSPWLSEEKKSQFIKLLSFDTLLVFIYKLHRKRKKANLHFCSTNEFINQSRGMFRYVIIRESRNSQKVNNIEL